MDSFDPKEKLGCAENSASPGSEIVDPRAADDFDPRCYPRADGVSAPSPEANERDDRIKLEFCAVYYQLNRLYARLIDLRRREGDQADERGERVLLQEIETHLRIRDGLEDRY